MATYYISGIWREHDEITHVMLHALEGNKVYKGSKVAESVIVRYMAKNEFYTATWNYTAGGWDIGSKVEKVQSHSRQRISQDRLLTRNLLQLLDYSEILDSTLRY